MMVFRQAREQEIDAILREGYKVWSRNRTFEQYCVDNRKEDAYGTRYVIDAGNEVVSSAILLNLADIRGKKVYGIGSVLTPKVHAGKGYATELLKNCIRQAGMNDSMIFLYSEINPDFYGRFGFKVLPPELQRDVNSVCMVKCSDDSWSILLAGSIGLIPGHF